MKAALLPARGVVQVAGEDARKFLNGLLTADIAKVSPQRPAYAALLTPQGKIMIDMIVAEAPAGDGGGFFLDCPPALCPNLVERLNFYKLRAKVIAEDLSEMLGVMAVWDGPGETEYGICYADPRLPELGMRCMLPPPAARGLGCAASCRRIPRATLHWISAPRLSMLMSTRRTASRWALHAAASTFITTTLSRTKPTWTSSTASISRKAAMWGRKWCPGLNTAVLHANASCRWRSKISPRRPASSPDPATQMPASWALRSAARVAGSRCCASIGPARRWRQERR